ncbi:alpha/beta fold hydrolase [Actinoalloteichus caeruleus]|uniref:Pimeloyl-ACP methyl ester carboxylesterase n=1 Tax=Actinoalloteichus caeruleus DSM 43889 TaxID=1120930 RepID=A0ABT1JIS5_ACTCY|nr:alpha/beta hydrolase [Actinoalloteichus caeruleus]MCP2332192.1 Pimeloyl-ACP methyl ester carboxylesterase [Actinoalloteichus caeruleus DSM 43889]
MTRSIFESSADLSLAGGPIRLHQAGPKGAPPVLLLHGAMLDTSEYTWRGILPGLARAHRVHAIDWPRHGGSRPWQRGRRITQELLEQIITELLDHLGIAKVTLVGLSMGGGVGLGYALNNPDRVERVAALAPGGVGARRPWQFLTWLTLRTPGMLRSTSWFLARDTTYLRKSMRGFLTAGEDTQHFETLHELAHAESVAKHRHREPALDDWQVLSYGPWRMALDHTPRLPGLRMPVLWIRGDEDPLVGHSELATAHQLAPDSRFVTLTDAGHVAPLDKPAEVTTLLLDFLAEERAEDTAPRA